SDISMESLALFRHRPLIDFTDGKLGEIVLRSFAGQDQEFPCAFNIAEVCWVDTLNFNSNRIQDIVARKRVECFGGVMIRVAREFEIALTPKGIAFETVAASRAVQRK